MSELESQCADRCGHCGRQFARGRRPAVGFRVLLGFAWSALLSVASAQVITNAPAKWRACAPVFGIAMDVHRTELPHNSLQTVRAEILDPALLTLIATANNLPTQDMAGLRLYKDPASSMVELYQIETGARGYSRAFNVVSDRLQAYVGGRKEGHTREYMFAAMTNTSILHFSEQDEDLRYLLVDHPMIPVAMVRKQAAGWETNPPPPLPKQTDIGATPPPRTNLVSRWTTYCVVDGPVAWGYVLHFQPDGSFDHTEEVKCDPIQLDPKYATLLKEVDAQVEDQMKKERTYGKFGSLRRFWTLRKERLKEKGIAWRSPAELNPNIRYE